MTFGGKFHAPQLGLPHQRLKHPKPREVRELPRRKRTLSALEIIELARLLTEAKP